MSVLFTNDQQYINKAALYSYISIHVK